MRNIYQFQTKRSGLTIELRLLTKEEAGTNENLVEEIRMMYATAYTEQYKRVQGLSPNDIHPDLDSWYEGKNSVKDYYVCCIDYDLKNFIKDPAKYYWVQATTTDKKLVGFAIYKRDWSDIDAAYANLLVVHLDYQHNGIGEQLVYALGNLGFSNFKKMHLQVRNTNEGAVAFYEKLGFQVNPTYQKEGGSVPKGFKILTLPSLSLQKKEGNTSRLFQTYCGLRPGFLVLSQKPSVL